MKKLIINLAPTGMVPTKQMSRFVPVTSAEITRDVLECAEIGVSIVHLHARNEDQSPAWEKEAYAEIISSIRAKRPELIVVTSTSGRTVSEFDKRSDVLNLEGALKPDMASLTLGSFNFAKSTSNNSPEMIESLARRMKERGVKPELEVFDLGMVNYAKYLISKGALEPPYYFNILLGNVGTAQANLQHIGLIVSELPPNSYWALAGMGNTQPAMTSLGVVMADGVRTGLEDNLWLDDARATFASNVALCKRVSDTARAIGREIATPDEVRSMLGLRSTIESTIESVVPQTNFAPR